MNEEKSGRRWREIVTPEWSLAILIHVVVLGILYVFLLLRPNGETLNTIILNTSAALPIFTLIAVLLMEIWEAVWRIIVLVKAILERREARRLEKARLEGLAEGLAEAEKKHQEWMEWAKNGQDKPQPKPPKDPEAN
ncbi:MAG: hypothetical protein OXI24_03710 [Candidatus Poribacteria bacterium]|nr:hypothetical protein [Candidatus Poribacteria bacterium]